jgi:ClpP class serine protease
MKKRLYRVSLKKLDYNSALIFQKKLEGLKYKRCEAIFIDISSANTRLTQSEDFVNIIKEFKSSKKDVPIYSFANETITGSSILVLLAADYAFLDPSTMIGLFDFNYIRNFYKEYLRSKKFNINLVTAGKYKIRLDPFKNPKQEDIDWMKNLLVKDKEILMERIKELRGNRLKVGSTELDRIFNSSFINPQQVQEYGLVDGLSNLDSFRMEKYKGIKIKELEISIIGMVKSMSKTGLRPVLSSDFDYQNISDSLSQVEFDVFCKILDNTLTTHYI